MAAKRRFHNGDIVALKSGGKWHTYIFRTLKCFTAPRIWPKGEVSATSTFLTDFRGKVRRVKFKEENLRLASEVIATLANELETFRNRR